MQLITRLLICLSITFTLVLSQTKEDLSRPYEFGFTVGQQQHRHEKKDERGIIQGEFGFITADGIYHVTVYATDENGNFKILSMRNLRVSAPLDGSPLPKGAKIETFPGQSNAAIAPQSQNPAPSTPPPQTNNYPGPATPSSIVFHPTIGPGCGGCKVIAKRPPNKPFTFQDAFQNNRGPNSVSGPNPGDGFPPNSNAPQGQVITQNGPHVTTQNGPGSLAPNVGIADRFSPNSNGPQGNTPNFGPNANIPGVNNPSSSSFGQNNPVGPNQGPNGAITNNFGPGGTGLDGPGPGGNKKPSFSVLPPSANTVEGPNPGINDPLPPSLPPISVDEGVIHVQGDHPMDIPIKDKFPGMQNGLPPQVSEKDITGILYKFRYTVGFHGHYEKGLKNGAKVGGYFVNGRDGVSRIVTYIADENGYRPKFKFVRLGLDSDETPKEGSEKSFGLKSFEFVWYPIE